MLTDEPNKENWVELPSKVNQVSIEFKPEVDNRVTIEMNEAFKFTLTRQYPGTDYVLSTILISSASEPYFKHKCPSRHKTGNGLDISSVNGKTIGRNYESDDEIKMLVAAIQKRFESAPKRRENFGPSLKHKNGQPHPVDGHKDHVHFSVNGDHTYCAAKAESISVFERVFSQRRSGVCES